MKEQMQQLQLTSDIFFSIVLEDIEVCQEVIRIITGENLEIVEVKNQQTILQIDNHSIRIDIWAKDVTGRQIGIEMHPQSGEDRVKRNRYNIASIDVNTFQKSKEYKELADVIAIYITNADFLKTKKGVNKVVRYIDETDKKIPNGITEYYICLSCKGKNVEQTELLQYMVDSNGISESKYFPNLVKRVQYLKSKREEVRRMCEIIDGIVNELVEDRLNELEKALKVKVIEEVKIEVREEVKTEVREEVKTDYIKNMIVNQIPNEVIVMITKVSEERIQKIQLTMC